MSKKLLMITGSGVISGSTLTIGDITGKKVAGAGDSITAADTVGITNGWLAMFCAAKGAIEVNMGHNGYTMTTSATSHPQWDKTTLPDYDPTYGLLIIALGTNDILQAIQGNTAFTPSAYITAYEAFIDYAVGTKGWPANRILVFSPYVIATSVADVTTQNNFKDAAQTVATAKGCIYADVHTATDVSNWTAHLVDGIHPADTTAEAVVSDYLQTL